MYEYAVVELRAQQSTTQHSSEITPAQSSKHPSTCRSEYIKISTRSMYVHACCVPLLFLSNSSYLSALNTKLPANGTIQVSSCITKH